MQLLRALSRVSFLASFIALVSGAVACGGSDDDEGTSTAALRAKCSRMCEHLLAPPLSGCGKSDASDQATCTQECYEHLIPEREGEAPEAEPSAADCGALAATCDAWNACGDLL